MHMFVSYLRVSTREQGKSGLGIEAQRRAVTATVNQRNGELIHEFVEVESGTNNYREELQKAIDYAKMFDATLVIANISRLSRNASFVLQLQESKVRFMCCDMPDVNDFTIGVMALVAQQQQRDISEATKRGLAEAKARGVVLGGRKPTSIDFTDEHRRKGQEVRRRNRLTRIEAIIPFIDAVYDECGPKTSASVIAKRLQAKRVPTISGRPTGPDGAKWTPLMVRRILRTRNVEKGPYVPKYRPESDGPRAK